MTQIVSFPVIASATERLSISHPKINTAFEAVIGQSSGATAPPDPVAYQFWMDTASDRFFQRNGANTDWRALWNRNAAPVANLVRPQTTSFSVTKLQPGVRYIDTSAGNVVVTLPAASTCTGMFFGFIKTTGDANTVTFVLDGSDTVEGVAIVAVLSSPYDKAALMSDGSSVWFDWFGMESRSIVTKTTTYTATTRDRTIIADATSAAFTITLPSAASMIGSTLDVKKKDPSGNAVTIDGSGAETIDGALTQVVGSQYNSITVQSDGTEWWII